MSIENKQQNFNECDGAKYSRRRFLQHTGIAIGASAAMPFLPVMQELEAATIDVSDDYKALVCIMLSGGNDSFNMLVPMDLAEYDDYQTSRNHLALNRESLYTLDGRHSGKRYGVHGAMPKTRLLFNQHKLSFIANIGALVEPTTKKDYQKNSVSLPLGLMSHADQLRHWLTSIPNQRVNYGVAGQVADRIQKDNRNQRISMNISMAGNNFFQTGKQVNEYAITDQGSVGLNINEKRNELDEVLYSSFNRMLQRDYESDFKQTYMDILRKAQASHEGFRQATKNHEIRTAFSESELSQQLKQVAKTIASAKDLGMKRQTFYVHYHGWDHHDELLNAHAEMLGVLDSALYEFNYALESLKLEENVMTFTASDFGRSLTSNGNGTDHAWGGNSIVMGGGMLQKNNGGKLFGEYPNLALESDLDIGGGVLIPTSSTDQLYAELLQWYGIKDYVIKEILPNLSNFKQRLSIV